MKSVNQSPIIFHNPDTIQMVRKTFDLDKHGRIDESIDRLQEWATKQSHFRVKEFPRDMLEILIIRAKGSVERAKTRLDTLCAYRTFAPKLFGVYRVRDLRDTENLIDAVMPRLTTDHYRVIIMQNNMKIFTDTAIQSFFRRSHCLHDYLLRYDYTMGFIMVADYRETNLTALISIMTKPETRQGLITFFKCYAARVKQIHLLTDSKIIDLAISAFKQIINPIFFERIYVHKTVEGMHEYMEKDVLPEDFGGKEKPLKELCENLIDFFSTDEHLEYMREMNKATIDISQKQTDEFNDQYLGMPGTFRSLSVD